MCLQVFLARFLQIVQYIEARDRWIDRSICATTNVTQDRYIPVNRSAATAILALKIILCYICTR